jgi:hypothetical protein
MVSLALFAVSAALAGVAAFRAPAAPVPAHARPIRSAPPVFRPRSDVVVRPAAVATPVIAKYGALEVHLPVPAKALTLMAFHQAGGGRGTHHMKAMVPVTPLAKVSLASVAPAASLVATGPKESAEVASAEETAAPPLRFEGKVVRLYRTGRDGPADTAADVGARGGTTILAPVTGTIVAVHRYMLYGQYQDYEVHLIPDGFPRVDVTVLHLSDPAVRAGQHVTGGLTGIGKVRWLSKLFESQLDEYTHDGGNHVHVQLDTAPRDGVVRLLGASGLEGLPGSGLTPKAKPSAGAVTESEGTPRRD